MNRSLQPSFKKNDKLAYLLIGILSFVVFITIVLLGRVKWNVNLGFNPHVFATINAIINSTVSVLLIAAYILIRKKNYVAHKKLMLTAIVLSSLFLVSYIAHHLFAGETKFGGSGNIRYFYFSILATHIILATIILPFILWTAYRSLTGDYVKHKQIARFTFPLWLYVSVTGVLVYLLISPYYN